MKIDEKQLNDLYRFACMLCGNRETAYDLVHDALEKFLRLKPVVRTSVEAYLRQSVRHRFYDHVHMDKSSLHDELHESDNRIVHLGHQSLETIAISQDELAHTWKKLQPIDREILFYWAVEGYTTAETATLCDMAHGTLLSRIHRLRRRLRPDDGMEANQQ